MINLTTKKTPERDKKNMNIIIPQRKCSKCGEVKDLDTGFYKDVTRNDGRSYACKICHRKIVHQYKKENAAKIKKQYRKYCKEHAEEIRERGRKFYKDHIEERRECGRKYYKEHIEEMRERGRKYYKEHAEERRKYARKYCKEHAEAIAEYKRKCRKEHAEEIRERGRKFYKDHIEEMRERGRKSYKENGGKQQREYFKKCVISLKDNYICKQITKRSGLKRYHITPEMIKLKREQLLLTRELKTLKQEIKHGT